MFKRCLLAAVSGCKGEREALRVQSWHAAVARPAKFTAVAIDYKARKVDVETRELSRLGAGAQSQVIYL